MNNVCYLPDTITADYQLFYFRGGLYIAFYLYDDGDNLIHRCIYSYGRDYHKAARDFRHAVHGHRLKGDIVPGFTADVTPYMQDACLHCIAVARRSWNCLDRDGGIIPEYDFTDPATMPDSLMRDVCNCLKTYEDAVGTL